MLKRGKIWGWRGIWDVGPAFAEASVVVAVVAGEAGEAGEAKKSPDVETPGLWYLDLISVVN